MSAAMTLETCATAYRQSIDQVLAVSGTDGEHGLNQSEVERFGRNQLTAEDAVPGWRRFLAQFTDVLVRAMPQKRE